MKHQLLSVLSCIALAPSLTAACQPASYAPPHTGIEFKLSSPIGEQAPLRPDGLFRVEGLDRRLSVYVPVAPLEPSGTAQRVELPPGAYRVSYAPVELDPTERSLRRRDAVESVSKDPFLVEVSAGRFTSISVRAVDAATQAEGARQSARVVRPAGISRRDRGVQPVRVARP